MNDPKPFPTPQEQEDQMAERRRQEAQERVERREKLGQAPQPEPALGDEVPETPDLPSVGEQLVDAQNEDSPEPTQLPADQE